VKISDLSVLRFLDFFRSFFPPSGAGGYQDSAAITIAGSGLAKVKRADWRLTGSAAERLAQNLQ
jgi:hypothetical protein